MKYGSQIHTNARLWLQNLPTTSLATSGLRLLQIQLLDIKESRERSTNASDHVLEHNSYCGVGQTSRLIWNVVPRSRTSRSFCGRRETVASVAITESWITFSRLGRSRKRRRCTRIVRGRSVTARHNAKTHHMNNDVSFGGSVNKTWTQMSEICVSGDDPWIIGSLCRRSNEI